MVPYPEMAALTEVFSGRQLKLFVTNDRHVPGIQYLCDKSGIPEHAHDREMAGQFSNQIENGNPRLIAGTFVGHGVTGGGSEGVFIGAFGAGN